MSTTFLHKPGAERSERAPITTIHLFVVPAAALALFSILIAFNSLHGNAAPHPGDDLDGRLAEAVPALPGSPVPLQQAVPAQIHASSTVSTCAVDVALVLDQSGSMNDDTYCWDCYLESDAEDFPSGYREYLPYDDWICETQVPITDHLGYEMLVAEAEYFDYSTSLIPGGPNDYRRDSYIFPNTFWMLQRTPGSQASGYACRYGDRLECGAHLMLMPHRADEDIPGNPTPYTPSDRPAPRLDYQFDVPAAGRWYAWIRAQCGARIDPGIGIVDSCVVHWGVDAEGTWNYSDFPSTGPSDFTRQDEYGFEQGSYGHRWDWVRLGWIDLTQAPHTVNVWGGGSGFRLDKIVLTRNPEWPAYESIAADLAPEFIRLTTPLWSDVVSDSYQTYYADNRYGGPPDTRGRSGQACHPCNPLYGQRLNVDLDGSGVIGDFPGEILADLNGNGTIDPDEICDNTLNDIFDDQQPIRAVQEAAKTFLHGAQARFDKAGLVIYDTQVDPGDAHELICLGTPGYWEDDLPDYPGVWDLVSNTPDPAWIWCYDHRTSKDGWSGPISERDPDVTLGSVIGAIENMAAADLTNIADGMRRGLAILSSDPGHYGRQDVPDTMIVMTDGTANRYPQGPCADDPDLWPVGGAAQDCVIYYANQARDSGVIVHTISLGTGADQALMQAIATRTGGVSYYAPTALDLDSIIDAIWHNVTQNCFALSIDKATPATVHLGETFTATIAVSSTAPVSTTGVIIQETIPEGTHFIAASGIYSPAHPLPGETVTWELDEIPHDGTPISMTLVLSVVQPLDAYASRAAVSSGRGLSATVEVGPALAKPRLLLSLSVTPTQVYGGQPFTYTIVARNTGDDDALDVRLIDRLPLSTTFVSASSIYVPPTPQPGETMTWTLGDIPNDGVPVTVTLVLTAAEPTGMVVLTNTVELICTQGITASSSTSVTVVEQPKLPHLLLSMSVAPDMVADGQPFTYTISVRNDGDAVALGVQLSDTLPVSTTFLSASGSMTPTHPAAGETLRWQLGDMASGGTPVTVTLTLATTAPTKTTVLVNRVTANCTQGITASAKTLVTVLERSPPWQTLYLPIVLRDARP
ncbi:MAG: DUF11 domain-containing protein [Anaerolineae bacterium]|nr:DUF11 domain-containing protein [Anaerolineae bacterium]